MADKQEFQKTILDHLSLCAARLRHIAGTKWGRKRYLNMDLFKDLELEEEHSLAEAI